MITYVYKCVCCKRTKELRCKMGEQPGTTPCDHCDCIMVRVYTPPHVRYKGTGWTRSGE